LQPILSEFIASLDFIVIPTNWKLAKEDPKWKEEMLEEMRALEKNKTWELVEIHKVSNMLGASGFSLSNIHPMGRFIDTKPVPW
jgi:hypothetical protein